VIDEKKLRELVSELGKATILLCLGARHPDEVAAAEQALIDYVIANSLKDKPVLWADRQADGRPDQFCIFPESLATDEMRGPWNWIPLYMKGAA
jgi:hypothetical protein